jgi:hypothetical protein
MWNLYSVTKGQQAIGETFRVMTDRTDNLLPLPGIFSCRPAPPLIPKQRTPTRRIWWGFGITLR